jgi:hypothetical protein
MRKKRREDDCYYDNLIAQGFKEGLGGMTMNTIRR